VVCIFDGFALLVCVLFSDKECPEEEEAMEDFDESAVGVVSVEPVSPVSTAGQDAMEVWHTEIPYYSLIIHFLVMLPYAHSTEVCRLCKCECGALSQQ
jgi:hypothetical protein